MAFLKRRVERNRFLPKKTSALRMRKAEALVVHQLHYG
jgi:hypothetical protein